MSRLNKYILSEILWKSLASAVSKYTDDTEFVAMQFESVPVDVNTFLLMLSDDLLQRLVDEGFIEV